MPPYQRRDAKLTDKVKLKASTHNELCFSITKGCGADFVEWMRSPWGGGKAEKEANQVGRRAMKFLMAALGDGENESCAYEEYIDSAIASPNLLMHFLKLIISTWELKAAAVLSYLQAISDLADFRKAKGCSDSVLRAFTVTEVYIRKCKATMQRRKNVEYTRDLKLEVLLARNSWCSLQEMNKVVPYHSKRFMEVVKKCRESEEPPSVNDLIFGSRFLSLFLIVSVKATRPMSIAFLTTQMIQLAHSNGGFVDATEFKTSKEYIFDSLKFTDNSLVIVDNYIKHIRPFCNPASDCHYVLLNSRGTQFTSIGSAMSLLVHEAIGKHINPTRYRQIIETASSDNLTPAQQKVVSRYQLHSSVVAER